MRTNNGKKMGTPGQFFGPRRFVVDGSDLSHQTARDTQAVIDQQLGLARLVCWHTTTTTTPHPMVSAALPPPLYGESGWLACVFLNQKRTKQNGLWLTPGLLERTSFFFQHDMGGLLAATDGALKDGLFHLLQTPRRTSAPNTPVSICKTAPIFMLGCERAHAAHIAHHISKWSRFPFLNPLSSAGAPCQVVDFHLR